MSFRITRAASPLLVATLLWAIISCGGDQQPESQAAVTQQVRDTTVPPHLRAFVMDTSAPFIAVVRNDLAHALERHRDKGVVATGAPITDPAQFVQLLRGSLARVDTLLAGRLKPRLAAVGFDTSITLGYAAIHRQLATASPSWESNDEQDLILREGGQLVYSGTRAIYTTGEADAIDTDAEFETNQFHKLAFIESVGSQPGYDPLGLPPETAAIALHCLYVSEDRAFLKDLPCDEVSYPVGSPPVPATMEVTRTRHPDREVPPVSRWEWSNPRSQNTIGVRCGKAWCQIALIGFNRTHHEQKDQTGAEPSGKQSHVLGWYDVQPLGMPSSAGVMEPKGPRALIRPLDALERQLNDINAPVRDTFLTVVEAKLYAGPASNSKYADWGLKNGWNELAICHGSQDACEAGTVPNESVCVANTDTDGRRWYVRIKARGASDSGVYRCLHFHRDAYGAAEFPSVARWMWLPRDEGIWVRCPQGCCQVN